MADSHSRRNDAGSVAVLATPTVASRLVANLESEGLGPIITAKAPQHLLHGELPATVIVPSSGSGDQLVARLRAVRRLLPEARFIVIAPSVSLRRIRELVAEGVDGVVLEEDMQLCLGLAVRSARAGQLSLPRSVGASLARPVLSTREKQALGLVVLGLTNGEIAGKLHLSQSTVKSHLSSAFSKLGARSRSEATALILDPEGGLGPGILTIAGGG
jgi:DNA-binding NarL/FixJ family response regulator